MRSISDTVDRLRRAGMAMPAFDGAGGAAAPGLTPLGEFGANPGDLLGFVHVPADLPAGAPLVVVLHGCTQDAAGYDRGSGWSMLAERHGFVVLFAQQQRGNNPNACFNWFVAEDTRRGGGEAASIRAMIAAVVTRHAIDPARVFVTGLSAGGAMASTMLATYPDVFAGGAIVAGLPHGVAHTMPEAFDRMRGHGYHAATLGAKVRAASDHRGPWPTVSVWHGTADRTVDVANAAMIVEQWRDVHGLGDPDVKGDTYRAWRDDGGRTLIEERLIPGMGHGTPIATTGAEACGTPMPYMLDAGISSTYRIAASWGIVPAEAPAVAPGAAAQAAPAATAGAFDPARMIDDALRAAGLIRP
ncbi:hypothetical protein ASG29_00730 [Sphingomonas sp. Leaf412]|uniref:extracellular catalytic domain type 1 short-chain-length polyhydroxyalkanoate depolymerase n=1 Tax=Sphingomonas sp. Leaf412 TaxID=1736370 RepID=UPI0006FD9553|nr:PHB depolymerase family esterase [Sphingomonas sp. Leaf412]KQT34724.1 hypothetical protein ASG29_00730 [Sphingomonas sp. Leaf412]